MDLIKYFRAAEAVNDCFQADHYPNHGVHPYTTNYLNADEEANTNHGFYTFSPEWLEEFRCPLEFCEDGRGAKWVL